MKCFTDRSIWLALDLTGGVLECWWACFKVSLLLTDTYL